MFTDYQLQTFSLDTIKQQLQKTGFSVTEVQDGIIFFNPDEHKQRRKLTNLKTVNQLPVQNLPKINKFRILDKKTEEYIRKNFTHEIKDNQVASHSKHRDGSKFIATFSPREWIFVEAFKKDYSPAYHSNDIKLFQINLLAESKKIPYQDFPMPHKIRMEHIINETTLEETKGKSGEDLKYALFYKTRNGKSVRPRLPPKVGDVK
ncbi:hypothetical protein Rin_00020620 [Candidatus Regiella insecticola 5.15]|uniref:Uncharacterized protein n=1 Tax=Candidatus Regiella insecticola 5.15 TaxID=1005043 RepID=G2H1W5_9ENTR|nr:hypothetical protein [Candidatus Regiella insecticola]EGY28016.1 hypothetical protein Rin_00020620 [Candidatus Regiella insecticola 5.15]